MMKEEKQQTPRQEPYNPLEKRNLGESIVKEMLSRPADTLPPSPFIGAGVYAIYYVGTKDSYLYRAGEAPIYVGKAVPTGARKGNLGTGEDQGLALYNRLRQHAESISCAKNLSIQDFRCRYLAVDDIWIPLAETLLIESFHPIWNITVEGFGNHDPGKGRYKQKKSAWDTLHPGRPWADRLQPCELSEKSILQKIEESF